jgi:DNA modification methylase
MSNQPYRRKEVIGDATLYLGDCREILPTLGKVDAVVTDPPYGIGESDASVKSRQRKAGGNSKSLADQRDYGAFAWDANPIGEAEVAMIRAASRWQIIFGGNYFPLPPSSCWLVWDKQNGDNDFADCELAWTNLPKAVRRIYWRWNGMIRKGSDERVHPTQKPVGVMRWCIEQLPADVTTVLDPYAGSGTTGVACIREGKAFIGIEREEAYFEHAVRRLREAVATPDMFVDRPAPAKQESLL